MREIFGIRRCTIRLIHENRRFMCYNLGTFSPRQNKTQARAWFKFQAYFNLASVTTSHVCVEAIPGLRKPAWGRLLRSEVFISRKKIEPLQARGHCVVFLGKTLNSHGATLYPAV